MNVFGSGAVLISQQLSVLTSPFGVGRIGALWGYVRPLTSVLGECCG